MPRWFTWADLLPWQRELFRDEPGKKSLTAICAHCGDKAVGSRRPRHAPNKACSGRGSGEPGQRVFVRETTANVVVPTNLTVIEAVKAFMSLLHQKARPDGVLLAGSLGEALRDARCVRVVATDRQALLGEVPRWSVALITDAGARPANALAEFVLVDVPVPVDIDVDHDDGDSGDDDADALIAVWSAKGQPRECVRLETFLALRVAGMLRWNSLGHYEWDAPAPQALREEVKGLRSAKPRSAYLKHLDYARVAQVVLHPEVGSSTTSR
jgi:hypothetical protein